MTVATLQDKLTASGAQLADYRGAQTPATFGDTPREFAALLQGCAVFDMSWQAKLVVSERDRVRWLNGMITNNIRDLALGDGVYSFVLNPKGQNQGDLVAYNRGDYLLMTTEQSQVSALTTLLKRYIIMDQVEIEDISDKLGAVGVAGPKASEVLSNAGIDVSQIQPGQVINTVWREMGISVARGTHPQMDGYEIWLARACRPGLGRAVGCWRYSGGQRCAGDVSHRSRSAALWSRSARARPCAGDGPGARAEFHQGLLHRAGDCGAGSRPRQRTSHFHRF